MITIGIIMSSIKSFISWLYACKKVNLIVTFGLLLIVMLQVLLKPTSVIQPSSYFKAGSISSFVSSPELERQYRKRLNLVHQYPEKVKDCTLGK